MLFGDLIMNREWINKDYFEWMADLVCRNRFASNISYMKLLQQLHDIEFTWIIKKDNNRAADGICLRDRYAYYYHPENRNISMYIQGPCSVLEMMIALAIRCETDIMQDPHMGDRTAQWFWRMIVNLGLGDMMDSQYDEEFVWSTINVFLNREYEPDGHGGLFTVRHCKYDLRKIEIWTQMLWYLDSIA